uniref:C2H2-type domain-containing protein n=1 Tax=Phlebotomus papatasi TaxID=29031 RepID=A0A1B0CZ08_PHLPP
MEILECRFATEASFCRLCFVREGSFRKIDNIIDGVASNKIIAYLVEKHLHVKIFEVSYLVCEDCSLRLLAFEEYYTKVHLHIDKYYSEIHQNLPNYKHDPPSEIIPPNLPDLPPSNNLPIFGENVVESFTPSKTDLEEYIPPLSETKTEIKEQVEEAPKRITRSSRLKKINSEQSTSQVAIPKRSTRKSKRTPKVKKEYQEEPLVLDKIKLEAEEDNQEAPELPEKQLRAKKKSLKRRKSISYESLGEFDFRDDDSDSDENSQASDWEEWPGAVNLSDFPAQIIENGLLKVKGKELLGLICKFYNLECNVCGRDSPKFPDLTDLFQHYSTVHQEKGYVMCCSAKFHRYPAIVMHMVRHIQPDAFKCNICGYMVTRPRFLESHKKTHLPEEQKPFACDHCPRRFCWKSALKVHKLTHEPKDVRKHFICDICGKIYDTPGGLCTHRKLSHTNYKSEPHFCHVCAKKFATRTGLNEHMATIHQPREKDQVQCQKCGKWLMNNRCLKSHMILHSSTFLRCESCDYTTKKESLLRRHQLTQHSDAKPFSCTICGRAFKLKRALTVHISQHENTKKQYKCNFCDRFFNSSTNFYTHRKTVHPEELNALNRAKLEEQRQKRIEAGIEHPHSITQIPNAQTEEKLIIVPQPQMANPVDFSNINQPVQTYQIINEQGTITTVISGDICE